MDFLWAKFILHLFIQSIIVLKSLLPIILKYIRVYIYFTILLFICIVKMEFTKVEKNSMAVWEKIP